ncbi:Hpt domain-containing protein [Marinilabilia sp.]|jgi:two-component system chemotaxis sensor kinase CheA
MTDQLEEIKRTFIDTSIEQLLGLKEKLGNADLLNPELEVDHLAEEVFMVMHGISGTAPMLGLETLAPVTQKMEVVFDKIRKGEKDLSEQLNLQTIRGIDNLISELRCNSEKIAL